MALVTTVGLFLFGIFGAALSRLLADELKGWSSWLVKHVFRTAISRLPEDQRERFAEEWRSHLDEVPGEIGKLVVALGLWSAARKMTLILQPEHRGTQVARIWKRILDLAISCTMLLFCAPLFVLIAVAIQLESPGPALIRRRRTGLDGKKFRMYTFRTTAKTLPDMSEPSRPRWRVTRVGHLLRLADLDRLPSLVNVLRGDMALVGPPPEIQ